jgi:hypothetical protein
MLGLPASSPDQFREDVLLQGLEVRAIPEKMRLADGKAPDEVLQFAVFIPRSLETREIAGKIAPLVYFCHTLTDNVPEIFASSARQIETGP